MKLKLDWTVWLRGRTTFFAVCAVLLALGVAVIDAMTWVELDVAAIYGLPLVLAALTRSRRLEAEQASSRKTRLLASASHDIRTPVNTISLMAEVIRRNAEDPELVSRIPPLARQLQANAAGLVELVSAMLDATRFEAGHLEYKENVFSLDDLLASHCRDLLPIAEVKGLTLKAELPDPGIRVRTDRVKLGRVMSNLLTNAIKFTEQGGVTVSAGVADDGCIVIRVHDTGIGIAAPQLDRIFGEFTQAAHNESDARGGWGLGLAISRRLLELMGGTIGVESELNRGTTFTATLPARCVVDPPDAARRAGLRMTVERYP
jgi:signal transduction histidine kinase